MNQYITGNMLKTKFYVCPVCGNVISTVGQSKISCHGVDLPPLTPEESDSEHSIEISVAEDEFFVKINHEMTKTHYISFIAALSSDGLQFKKLYPEGNAEARFKINGVRCFYYYCNKDGLFERKRRG